MRATTKWLLVALLLLAASPSALAWSGFGHRTVAAIAAQLLPPDKVLALNLLLAKLEIDGNFIDAAAYPDEYIADHDPTHRFSPWHYAALPEDDAPFDCGDCLFKALLANLTIIRQGVGGKDEAVAIAWLENLVGDLHQPLNMDGRDGRGTGFPVTYRGEKTCASWSFASKTMEDVSVQLHSVWDACLVQELAGERSPEELAKDILGDIKTYKSRPELGRATRRQWLAWGIESHEIAARYAFDHLTNGVDLEDAYILGDGNGALSVVQRQLLVAGIRLAFLLDRNFARPQTQ